jgi:parallel beta-helix repeat protein
MVVETCAAESDIAAAFASVRDNDTIAFEPGTYTFTNQLALGTANGVTVIGPGKGQVTLDFHGQAAGEDGLFAQSVSNLTFQGFSIKDTPGNGVRVLGVTGITFRDLGVTWTAMNDTDGSYAIYPVQSKQVLIENCTVSGASDSGLYVGQSQQIVVRNNEVFGNVGGIEIENSYFADVHDNNSHDNTAGILVFGLPGLQQEGGHDIRVYNNKITNNNTGNFAVKSDIVSIVPAGTGYFVMAVHDVEIFGNTITTNQTGASGIISYAVSQLPITDMKYYQYPARIHIHDNTYSGNGTNPDVNSTFGLLLTVSLSLFPGGTVGDILWDGIPDPSLAASDPTNPMTICVSDPTASAVCNMNLAKADPNAPSLDMMVCDATPFECTLPSPVPVTWPGLMP